MAFYSTAMQKMWYVWLEPCCTFQMLMSLNWDKYSLEFKFLAACLSSFLNVLSSFQLFGLCSWLILSFRSNYKYRRHHRDH